MILSYTAKRDVIKRSSEKIWERSVRKNVSSDNMIKTLHSESGIECFQKKADFEQPFT